VLTLIIVIGIFGVRNVLLTFNLTIILSIFMMKKIKP
jgi:hypothetical protein